MANAIVCGAPAHVLARVSALESDPAPVFAVLIALAGTYRGLQVQDSSRELGRLTTTAVVQSIFLVILADALFAVLFMEIGI